MAITLSSSSNYTICTSGTRPTTPPEGQLIYETDTDKMYFYTGSAWQSITQPGSVLQTVYVRSDTRTTYAAATSGNGTTMTELNLTITPQRANSIIILEWTINCEVNYNTVFLVHKDATLQTSPAGYNSTAGNERWSGMATVLYDANDVNSTMNNVSITYVDNVLASTSARTYAPAVRASSGTAYTLYLNRPAGSTGADNYEVGVSYGVAMEIRQ